ncbi:hypothetical protein ATY81_21990 [Rhizobium sp. R72]|uniref:hypothetical protein n=1 Tax=unclassified Rhizobium TaxID=2613769 RepID=UPI000B66158D|nr:MULTISPECIES: hypothetical protein [unclassified Rhizobium]OWW02325.1 hypothetical protein ATY81_21990 [Rhizobium sp. R72]OWW02459.1 hypothetical protein ATY80_21990 [Rhizobium sp. R711]
MLIEKMLGIAALATALLTGCGTVKEKTAPCKRPLSLTSFASDTRQDCAVMRPVNDPAAAFAAIGVTLPDEQ